MNSDLTADIHINYIKYLENNPNISILAPKLLNTDGSLQISCWKFPDVKNIILESLFMHTFFKLNRYSMTNFNSVFEVDSHYF